MFDYQQKRKLRTAFESPITWSVVMIITGLMTVSAFNRYQIAYDMEVRREEAQKEVEKLKERKEELEVEVEYLSNERGIEAEIRRQYDVAKDGEQIVIMIEDAGEGDKVKATSSADLDIEKPWYQFW